MRTKILIVLGVFCFCVMAGGSVSAEDKDDTILNKAGISLRGPAMIQPHAVKTAPVKAAPATVTASDNGGTIIIICSLWTIGDLHRPAQPIAGEAYQLLDPRGNIIGLIRNEASMADKSEGDELWVIADKVSKVPGYPNLYMMEEVTDSKEVTPGSVLASRSLDVNEDGVIDAKDVTSASSHFGTVQGVDRVYDLNYDGVVDYRDISLLKAYDGRKTSAAYGGWPDLNNDGMANVHDLITLIDHIGDTVTGSSAYDLNGDGKIDEKDMGVLKAFYGYGTLSPYAPVDIGMPFAQYSNGKITSLTIFAADGMTADKYIFDSQGNAIQLFQYGIFDGKVTGSLDFAPQCTYYNDGKLESIITFYANGKPNAKYVFGENGKVIDSDFYEAPIYIEPPDFAQPPAKPEKPVITEPIDPGIINLNPPPAITVPKLPDVGKPTLGDPNVIAPQPPLKEPIKSPVITLPIDGKNSGSTDIKIPANAEVVDKMIVLQGAKTTLPAGVSLSGEVVTKNAEKAPAKAK